jgi:GntR family transcriptional regulator/MocR family aminotransferase
MDHFKERSMRRSRGVFLPPPAVSRPRRADLHRVLKSALLDGVIAAGARLPSTRQAAADYGVSRGLMEEVYAQLTDEGFLERGVGRGTFASSAVPRPSPRTDAARRLAPVLSRRGLTLAANAACREPDVLRPFNAGVADAREFPWRLWARIEARAARELARNALAFADPRGLPALRASIARYLAQFRGIRCDADQVVVFNSAQQALVCLAVLLVNRDDAVWIEDPCYLGARAAFSLAGARLRPIPVDAEGLRVDALARHAGRSRLGYVTPANQYPTGVALTLERRTALLEWNASRGGWIIEDDYDGEFRHEGQPLTPLHALDSHGRTIYIGTLNKSMFVSLRLAFAVVPHAIVEPLANLRTQFDGFTTPVHQLATSLFMDEGHFASHLRRMRAIYRAKRSALVEVLHPLSALGWTWPPAPAGMHLLLRHADGRYARRVAVASGLDLALLGTYRSGRRSDDGLFLRFGALDTPAIVDAASALSRAAGASLNAAIS